MAPTANLSRRTVIGVGGALVGGAGAVLALAGCSELASTGSAVKVSGELAPLADIPVGGAASVMSDGEQVLISQPKAGKVVAFSAVCPHQGCKVSADGEEFVCPCHNSLFDLATGEVLQGPATTGLTPIPVSVSGASVVAD